VVRRFIEVKDAKKCLHLPSPAFTSLPHRFRTHRAAAVPPPTALPTRHRRKKVLPTVAAASPPP
jgi:hypothetical protein